MKQLGLPMSSDVSVYKPEREPKGIQLGIGKGVGSGSI